MATVKKASSNPFLSNQNNRSYADILRHGTPSSSSLNRLPEARRDSISRSWRSSANPKSRCYQCGGGGHMAKECRDPMRYFRCGMNGHRSFNCSRYRYSEPKILISNLSLAQSLCSMIYQDDTSIRLSEYNRTMMNDEQCNFNLNYLKLRKYLILGYGMEKVGLIRLLDGLFNSSYKINTIASLLLDEDSDLECNCEKKEARSGLLSECNNEKKEAGSGFLSEGCNEKITNSDLSPSFTLGTEVIGRIDSLLMDPNVASCRSTFLYEYPSTEPDILYADLAGGSLPLATVELLREDPDVSDTSYTCPVSIEITAYGDDKLEPTVFPGYCTEYTRCIDTDLVLFNSFDLLDVCLEEEYSRDIIEDNSNGLNVKCKLNYADPKEYRIKAPAGTKEEGMFLSLINNVAAPPADLLVPVSLEDTDACYGENGPNCIKSKGVERGTECAQTIDILEQGTTKDLMYDVTDTPMALNVGCVNDIRVSDTLHGCDYSHESICLGTVAIQDSKNAPLEYSSNTATAGAVISEGSEETRAAEARGFSKIFLKF